MLFNSFEFSIFLPLVFLCYWILLKKNLKAQNFFIVCVSYLFYGWWDWRFLILIAITTTCSYFSGILIEKYRAIISSQNKYFNISKLVLVSNILLNLLILGTFKYFNFFSENIQRLFEMFGYGLDWVTIDILLPVGISFYTFQALSYSIDVYKKKIEATHDIIAFFAFVSFFPQLVAGPIERATNLLPQFYTNRIFDYNKAIDGMRQILWGFFKKIAVADNCAIIVNDIFNNYTDLSGSTLFMGAIFFTFQIYGDFSGYSDIALGTARLFGFELMQNFKYPYFSRDIAEFWRRWHISLTTWFRDYIYIPLGGSRVSKIKIVRNTFIIFLISGFWHGANWTFIIWGLYHAILFLPLILLNKNRKNTDIVAKERKLPSIKEILQMGITLLLVIFGWIIFRAENIQQAYLYITNIFTPSLFSIPTILGKKALLSILILLIAEWIQRKKDHALQIDNIQNGLIRYLIYMAIIFFILFFGEFGENQFIYFQF